MRSITKLGIFTLALFCLLVASKAQAATLGIAPITKSVNTGDSFTVVVELGSPDQPVNAFSGKMNFSKEFLRVSNISKTGSIADFWVDDPAVLDPYGSIPISGVILNPGFIGTNGKVLTVTFTAIKAGIANFSFSEVEILANDGIGTDIFSGSDSGSVKINDETEVVEVPSEEAEQSKPEKIELWLTDYPREVWQGDSFTIDGKGSAEPIIVYGIKTNESNVFSTTILYQSLTSGGYTTREEAILRSKGFQAEFKGLSAGKYAFYAKDSEGGISNIVYVDVKGNFWVSLEHFVLNWWWLVLVAIFIFALFHFIWHLGETRALHHQRHLSSMVIDSDAMYAKIIKKLDMGIVLTHEEKLFLDKLRSHYRK